MMRSLVLIAIVFGSGALTVWAQSGMTIDQVEAQVVALQGTVAGLQTNCNQTQANFNALFGGTPSPSNPGVVYSIPALYNQLQTLALNVSTVGVLTQLGADNETDILTLQAQVATLQAQVAALTPAAGAKTLKRK